MRRAQLGEGERHSRTASGGPAGGEDLVPVAVPTVQELEVEPVLVTLEVSGDVESPVGALVEIPEEIGGGRVLRFADDVETVLVVPPTACTAGITMVAIPIAPTEIAVTTNRRMSTPPLASHLAPATADSISVVDTQLPPLAFIFTVGLEPVSGHT